MKKAIKFLSVFLAVIMFVGCFSAANPVLATGLQENAVTEETVLENYTDIDEESSEPEIINEIEEKRTETVKHFYMSDGSYRAVTYNDAVHYYDNNEWKNIDNELVYNESNETYENKENSFKAVFSEDLGSDKLFSIENDGYNLSWEYQGNYFKQKFVKAKKITAAEPENEFSEYADNINTKIMYEEFEVNSDLEYVVTSTGVKENIILNKQTGKNKFKFNVTAEGLSLILNEDGSISARNSGGEEKFYIPAPFMYDSKGEYCYDVAYELNQTNNGYFITIVADKDWLKSENTVYPVTIDPRVETRREKKDITSTFIASGNPNTNYYGNRDLYIGHESAEYLACRALFKMDLPQLNSGDVISGAYLCVVMFGHSFYTSAMPDQEIQAHLITEDWEASAVKWNNQPDFDNVVLDYDYITREDVDTKCFDITKAVKGWNAGTFSNYGILIRKTVESGNLADMSARGIFWSDNANSQENAYPVIILDYRNHKGIESQWSYSSYSAGTAGTAYVNDYTGNLVYELPLISGNGQLAPLNLTAYYNNYCASQMLVAGKDGSSRTSPGRGFRLNIQQTVIPSSEYGLTGETAEKYPYVYTDGDGTEHYIQEVEEKDKDGKTQTKLKDEDGLGLELEVSENGSLPSKYVITDKADNKYYFNTKGNLSVIKDTNANSITINFCSANSVDSIPEKSRISYITDGSGHKYDFEYYTKASGGHYDYIRKIKDDAGRVVEFDTNNGLIESVTYPTGDIATFNYTDDNRINWAKSNGIYEINFDYGELSTGRQINVVREIGRNGSVDTGARVEFDRTKYNTTVIRSSGSDGVYENSDDVITTMQFDNAGRTVSQHTLLANGAYVSAGSNSFTSGADDTSTGGFKNKISGAAGASKAVENKLYGGNCENLTHWSNASSGTISYLSATSSTHQYMGNKSLCLRNDEIGSTGARSFFGQTTGSVTVNKYYTLSAYVKVAPLLAYSQTAYNGAYIQLAAYNGSGVLESVTSTVLSSETDSNVNNGWRRLSATLLVPEGTTSLKCYLVLRNARGIAYFDCVQLEKSSTPSKYNLLENSGFENEASNMPCYWNAVGDFAAAVNSSGAVTNGVTTAAKTQGLRSLCITGEPEKSKGISQTVAVQGNPKDTYIVSGWAVGYPVNSTFHRTGEDEDAEDTALFEIAVRVTYSCYDEESKTTATVHQVKESARFNTTITTKQFATTPVVLKYTGAESGKTYTPTHITIVPRYNNQENYVFFDNLMLEKDVTSSYTYDKDGNIVSTATDSEHKYSMEYDDNDNLTSYTDALNLKTTLGYDAKKNLTSANSPRGIKTEYTYTAQGNLLWEEYHDGCLNSQKEEEGRTPATKSILTKTFQTEAEKSGGVTIKAGAYVDKTTDEQGYITDYRYNPNTGYVEEVKNPKGVVTEYKYDNNKLSSVETNGTKVLYSYDGDNKFLSSITFANSADTVKETYSFTYDSFGNKVASKVGNQTLSTNSYLPHNAGLNYTKYGNGDIKKLAYNSLGLCIGVYNSETVSTPSLMYSWKYDSSGRTVRHTDKVNGKKYNFDYDSLNRPIRRELLDKDDNYLGAIEVGYDGRNNQDRLVTDIGGRSYTQLYSYGITQQNEANSTKYRKDNLPTIYWIGSYNKVYDYDSLNRKIQSKFSTNADNKFVYLNYQYRASNRNEGTPGIYTTNQLEADYIDDVAYIYSYDEVGNITSVKKGNRLSNTPSSANFTKHSAGVEYRNYTYDLSNQLTSEERQGKKQTWRYDALGNLEASFIYGNGADQDYTAGIDYKYTSVSGWKKLLTSVVYKTATEPGTFDESKNVTKTITYDAIGNPTNYLGNTLSWYGRQLKSYKGNGLNIAYTYDSEGLRATKITPTEKYEYLYNGDLLSYMSVKNKSTGAFVYEMYFFYDSYGHLSHLKYFKYTGTDVQQYNYIVLTNSFGDILSLYGTDGEALIHYEYDAWGNVISVKNSSNVEVPYEQYKDTIAHRNPIRYRGYVYDTDTKFYYLQSRYYNPELGRFLNADGLLSTGQGVLGHNMFSYCQNNPVNCSDPTGHAPEWLHSFIDKAIDFVVDKMTKSKIPFVRCIGYVLSNTKKAKNLIDASDEIMSDPENIKNQYVEDIYNSGVNQTVIKSTPNSIIFPDLEEYRTLCSEKYDCLRNDILYSTDQVTFDKELAINTIECWDMTTCWRITYYTAARSLGSIISEVFY